MSTRELLRRQLADGLSQLSVAVPENGVGLLLDYVDLLVRWNRAYNLTAVREPAQMVTRHLLDSLAIAPHLHGDTLIDLGTGAGLPGVPLAIQAPHRQVTLVDSNGKKVRFLREVQRRLALQNIEPLCARVESLSGLYACVTARAFASLADMLQLAGHLLAADGHWLALKGRVDDDELAAVPAPFRVHEVHSLTVPGLDAQRHLVIIKRDGAHEGNA